MLQEMTKTQLYYQLDTLTDSKNWIIKTDSTTYEYHFIPKKCNCGGVPEIGYGYPSAEEAIKAAIEKALIVNSQGFHTHYNKVVKDKKGTK
jgi:hypothetical protein